MTGSHFDTTAVTQSEGDTRIDHSLVLQTKINPLTQMKGGSQAFKRQTPGGGPRSSAGFKHLHVNNQGEGEGQARGKSNMLEERRRRRPRYTGVLLLPVNRHLKPPCERVQSGDKEPQQKIVTSSEKRKRPNSTSKPALLLWLNNVPVELSDGTIAVDWNSRLQIQLKR